MTKQQIMLALVASIAIGLTVPAAHADYASEVEAEIEALNAQIEDLKNINEDLLAFIGAMEDKNSKRDIALANLQATIDNSLAMIVPYQAENDQLMEIRSGGESLTDEQITTFKTNQKYINAYQDKADTAQTSFDEIDARMLTTDEDIVSEQTKFDKNENKILSLESLVEVFEAKLATQNYELQTKG